MALGSEHCVPCEGGVPPLREEEAAELHREVPEWTLREGKLRRTWRLADFQSCLGRANAIGTVAEEEGHHPDLHITQYRNLEVVLWTHAIGGLSRNDFILAARIDDVMA